MQRRKAVILVHGYSRYAGTRAVDLDIDRVTVVKDVRSMLHEETQRRYKDALHVTFRTLSCIIVEPPELIEELKELQP